MRNCYTAHGAHKGRSPDSSPLAKWSVHLHRPKFLSFARLYLVVLSVRTASFPRGVLFRGVTGSKAEAIPTPVMANCAWASGRPLTVNRCRWAGPVKVHMRVVLTVPDEIFEELAAAARACFLTNDQWASEALHAALAVRRLCRQDATPHPTARLPGDQRPDKAQPEDAALDTLADVLPTTDDLSVLDDIA
jgi:hypothetical protein